MTDHIKARLTAQQRDIEHLQRTIADLQASLTDPHPDNGPAVVTGDDPAEPEPDLLFDSITAFVEGFVEVHYERTNPTDGHIKWFPCWPDHPAALWVMEILWGSFEEARAHDIQDGGGSNSATWMTNSFLPLMDWVVAHDGPMGLCSTRHCDQAKRLGQSAVYPTGQVA